PDLRHHVQVVSDHVNRLPVLLPLVESNDPTDDRFRFQHRPVRKLVLAPVLPAHHIPIQFLPSHLPTLPLDRYAPHTASLEKEVRYSWVAHRNPVSEILRHPRCSKQEHPCPCAQHVDSLWTIKCQISLWKVRKRS